MFLVPRRCSNARCVVFAFSFAGFPSRVLTTSSFSARSVPAVRPRNLAGCWSSILPNCSSSFRSHSSACSSFKSRFHSCSSSAHSSLAFTCPPGIRFKNAVLLIDPGPDSAAADSGTGSRKPVLSEAEGDLHFATVAKPALLRRISSFRRTNNSPCRPSNAAGAAFAVIVIAVVLSVQVSLVITALVLLVLTRQLAQFVCVLGKLSVASVPVVGLVSVVSVTAPPTAICK